MWYLPYLHPFVCKPFLIKGTIFAILWLQSAIFDKKYLKCQVSVLQNKIIISALLSSTLLYSTLLYTTLLYAILPYPTLSYPCSTLFGKANQANFFKIS